MSRHGVRGTAQGRARQERWASGRGAGSRHRARRQAQQGARTPHGARGLGVLLGQQAVHSVHSACFDPV